MLTLEGISNKTIPSHSRDVPLLAWSLVICVSFKKLVVSTPDILERSSPNQKNRAYNMQRFSMRTCEGLFFKERVTYSKNRQEQKVCLPDCFSLFFMGPGD